MRILITTDTYSPSVNGVVVSTRNLVSQLREQGHDVMLLAPAKSSHLDDGTYYVRSIPVPLYPDARFSTSNLLTSKVTNLLKDWKPQIVHSQTEFSTFKTARDIAISCNAAHIHTYHTLYEDYTSYFTPSKTLGEKVVASLSRNMLKHLDAVVVPTQKIERVLEQYGLETHIEIIPTGIDLAKFWMVPDEMRTQIRTLWNIPQNAPVILLLGRLGAEKRMHDVIKAFPAILARHSKAKLLIVGDGPERQALELLAQNLNIAKSVIFTGAVTPEECPAYYKAADIFASASVSETQGLTYLEAQASGLPLVCRKDECLEGVLVSGHNGFEFTTTDELVSSLTQLIENQTLRTVMGKAGYESSSAYDMTAFGKRAERLYEKVLTNPVRTPQQPFYKHILSTVRS